MWARPETWKRAALPLPDPLRAHPTLFRFMLWCFVRLFGPAAIFGGLVLAAILSAPLTLGQLIPVIFVLGVDAILFFTAALEFYPC